MPFESFLKRGLLKKQKPDFQQIEKQIQRAKKDLSTSKTLLGQDAEWAATIAYQAMLRTGRAFIYSNGYLPADGAQHKTVVELTGMLLGKDYLVLVEKFEKLRRKRNLFFYESDPFGSKMDAESALQAATKLIHIIEEVIKRENPQQHLDL